MAELILFPNLPESNRAALLEDEERRRERHRAAVRKHRAKNPEAVNAKARAYYAKDLEKSRAHRRETQRRWKQAHPHRHRELNFKSRYGITFAERDKILAAQGDCCAACKTTEPGGKYKKWHMDHDHSSGKIRGIL